MADMRRFLDLTGLGIYDEKIKAVIATGDSNVLAEAKKYFDDNKNLFEAAGSVQTAKELLQAAIDAVDAKVGAITNGETISNFAGVEAALAGKQAVGDYATKAEAQAMADGKDAAIAAAQSAAEAAASAASVAQGEVDALEQVVANLDAYVGKIPEGYTESNVIAYINKKAQETLDAASGGSSESAASVLAALNTYKAENDPKVNKNIEDIAAANAAIDTEKQRAEGIEAGLRTDINTVMGDYLKAEDKAELQGNITTVSNALERLTNGVSAEEIDGVNDLINYVKEHGPEVTAMQEDIGENAEAIAVVAGRMTTAEDKIAAVEGAVATKVEQETYEAKIAELAGADSAMSGKIAALEAKFGGAEGSVEDMIADAKQEAIDAAANAADTKDEAVLAAAKKHADDADALIGARIDELVADAATHALKSEVEAVAGRMTTAEGEIDALQAEMGEVQAAVATKAAASDLTTLAGRVTTAEGKITVLEGEMDAVEGRLDDAEEAIETKADASVVDGLATRMGTAETNIAANAAALAKFTEITSAEIDALFV